MRLLSLDPTSSAESLAVWELVFCRSLGAYMRSKLMACCLLRETPLLRLGLVEWVWSWGWGYGLAGCLLNLGLSLKGREVNM